MKFKGTKKIGKDLLIMFVLACVMVFAMCPECIYSFERLWMHVVITYTIWIVMWFGITVITRNFDQIYSWIEHPAKRFFLEVLAVVIYSAVAMLALIWIFKYVVNITISDSIPETIYMTIGVSIAVLLVMMAKGFLFSWREVALREEKMKNEVLTSKFELLKNQVNPHFMFNSLNTLRSLIYQDKVLADKYVEQLSKVYRSVLTSGQNEVVTLEEELKMLESYIFLQSIRFEDRFEVNIDLGDEIRTKSIPPMVLQLLIENAIKHNEITSDHPLVIDVYKEGNMLYVRNKIALKKALPGDSTAIGLQNIKARYEVLSSIPVEVLNDGKEFTVKLPLLDVV